MSNRGKWKLPLAERGKPPKDYRPKAERSGMIGTELPSKLADLKLSLNELARVSGITGETVKKWCKWQEPGHIPVWIDAVLGYARLNPWFGRRFRDHSSSRDYVYLRGSTSEFYEKTLVTLEHVGDAMLAEDEDAAYKRCLAHARATLRMAVHFRDIRDRKRAAAAAKALEEAS